MGTEEGEEMNKHIRDGLPVSRLAKRVRWVMRRIQYKPGYGLAMQEADKQLFIYIYVKDMADADGEVDTITRVNGQRVHIRKYAFETEILHAYWLAVQRFEAHESNDWFKFEGKRIIDEHGNWAGR